MLYPLLPEFITANIISAGRPNYLDRDYTSLAVPPVSDTTTAAATVAADDEVNNDDTSWKAQWLRW